MQRIKNKHLLIKEYGFFDQQQSSNAIVGLNER